MPTMPKILAGSLRTKVYASFAAVLLLSSAAAGTYHLRMVEMSRQVDDLLLASEQSRQAAQLNTDIGEARRTFSVYLRTGAARDLLALRKIFAGAREDLVPLAKGNPQLVAKLSQSMDSYAAIIDRIAQAVAKQQTVFGTLFAQATAANNIATMLLGNAADEPFGAFPGLLRLNGALAAEMRAAARFNDSLAGSDRDVLLAETGRVTRELEALRAGDGLPAGSDAAMAALLNHGQRAATAASGLAEAASLVLQVTNESRDGGAAMVQATLATIDNIAQQFTRAGNDAKEGAQSALRIGLTVSLLAVLAALLTAWLFGRSLSRPITRLTGTMRTLSEGDLSADVPDTRRRDEIGAMARAVEIFKQNGLRMRAMEAEQATQAAEAEEARRRGLLAMADQLEAEVKGVVEAAENAATDLRESANGMSGTVRLTTERSTSAALGAESASGNIQMVAAAAEELSASINEITRQVSASTAITRRASTQAAETSSAMVGLAGVANQIGQIISLVERIAGQTNLLALNATIEAARAGEAGKGFAVVASEVKNLAAQTAKATEEIAAQVGAIQSGSQAASAAMQAIASTISEIENNSASIAAAIEEQGAATQEIARNVQEAAQGAGDATRNITGVQEVAAEAGEQAATVQRAAVLLSEQSVTLRQAVDGFLDGMRQPVARAA
ncbi:methyl-accepting chemotaxis protein [Roseomonas elaeocarpi]|uniref:Methyl-accepting chemotaxis protein n=1 Tax=Roseomonas elaeocarpi TaxID=907779 RepID=A0ABV6JTR8_9PROT